MKPVRLGIAAVAATLALGGCATWDSMSQAEKGTVIGAGVGGVAGSAISNNALGTIGGAAVGGVVGHEIGRHEDNERYDGRRY